MAPKRIIIDTDPGIDDSLAILLALASPELKVEGIVTVHGNCTVEQGTVNALSILELAQAADVPVAKGFSLPLVQPPSFAAETHGESGLGYAKLPNPQTGPQVQHGSDYLIEQIMSSPGEMTLVAVGPLTNVAVAIRKEPRVAQAVKEIVIMGGAIRHQGNETPSAEFNMHVDPHAAHIVFQSGMPITLVPLDVTYQCILTPEDVERLNRLDSPITKFIDDATRFYMEFHDEYQEIKGCAINDPLALALTIAPELCSYEELYVEVDISGGISTGNTSGDFYHSRKRSANMKVALGVRARDFIELFLERMEILARSLEVLAKHP